MRSPASKPDRALAAIAIGMMWVVANTDVDAPPPDRVALLACGAILAALVVTARLSAGYVAAYAVLIAFAERIHKVPLDEYSDVLRATREAIEVFLAGANPYAHTMLSTYPVGSPFPYPPGEFLFYLPAYLLVGDIRWLDLAASIGITAAIALAGIRVGFSHVVVPAMLYATWLYSSFHAADGSNETAAAFVLPFLVMDPEAFVRQQIAGLTFHTVLSGINIPFGLAQLGIALPPLVSPIAQLVTAVALFGWCVARRAAGLGRATLQGTFAMVAILLLTGWTSQAYWLYAAATGLLGIALLEDDRVPVT